LQFFDYRDIKPKCQIQIEISKLLIIHIVVLHNLIIKIIVNYVIGLKKVKLIKIFFVGMNI
jgi:hypothetical protein